MKILTHFGHAGHQYELWKLKHDFTCVQNIGGLSNTWSYNMRPLHEKIKTIDRTQVNPKDYDLAIVHIDEFFIQQPPILLNRNWGGPFKFFKELDIPKIYICHGTPRFFEKEIQDGPDKVTYNTELNKKIRDLIGNDLIICNSHQAKEEWGFKNSKVIWHGFDPEEFKQTDYSKGLFSMSLGKVINRPIYNGYTLYNKVINKLIAENIEIGWFVPNTQLKSPIDIFNNYLNNLAKFSIFFNPTRLSPMPRNRGESMMCGIVQISSDNHDAKMFIKNNINGYVSNNSEELVNIIKELLNSKSLIIEMGNNARKTAIELFHIDRYLNDWNNILKNSL